MEKKVTVEVAYAAPAQQKILRISVPEGTNMVEAVRLSGILDLFPEIDLASSKLGIFSKMVPKPELQVVQEGDRIEIYRPLLIDPKQARLNRAKKAAE
ncbi:MAG: RnfH family protein [Hahellaceae bacterium]|nr:RnfH family protein [Hahellaceae bacterium]QIQ10526.1 Persistence and stress-resistance antitoxin PasI [uncultured bacterium]